MENGFSFFYFFWGRTFLLWATLLCHSLVRHTFTELLSKRKIILPKPHRGDSLVDKQFVFFTKPHRGGTSLVIHAACLNIVPMGLCNF